MTQIATASQRALAPVEVRPFSTLGHANHGWLDAHHHFSFANYHDPARMNWGPIRVWNDDTIAAKSGFPPHPHSDMEIITYIRAGAITHKDSLGNTGRTEAGDVQVMSAGGGITHAEYNMEDGETRLFQIWIIPTQRGGAPSWGTRPFPRGDRANMLTLLASGYGEDGALPIRTNARVFGAELTAGTTLNLNIADGQCAYLVLAEGQATINGVAVNVRDGVALQAGAVEIITADGAELVMVEAENFQ
jgi:quercetin 2,3-dioxygenase